MLKKYNIHSKDDSKLYRKHFTIKGHLSRRNNLILERDNILNSLTIYQVRSAFDFNYSFVGADNIIVMLKVKAIGNMGTILKEDIANKAVNNVVYRRVLLRS
jgi:hypothetical protein